MRLAVLAIGGLALATLASSAFAQTVIVQDSFSGDPNSITYPIGTQTTVDLPGTSLQQVGGSVNTTLIWATTWGFPPGLYLASQGMGVALSLGSYNTGSFEISADLLSSNGSGVGDASLGFYGAAPAAADGYANPLPGFYGLELINTGTASTTGIAPVIDGTVGPLVSVANDLINTPQLLNFVVNADGSLGTVLLNGTAVAGLGSVSFGTGNTNYFGFVDGFEQNNRGYITNLTLTQTAVPEPGTYAMVLSGLGMLLGIQRMRSRRSA